MQATPQHKAEREARALLDELAHWEQLRAPVKDPNHKSTGEDNARITELQRQLQVLGARYHRGAQGYVLDGIEAGAPTPGGRVP